MSLSDNQKIILIDDDKLTNYINRCILERCLPGVSIQEFIDTKAALSYLRLTSEKPNEELLILLDINMPQHSGWDILDIIETEFPELNALVAMLTSSIDKSDRIRADKYERVISFISKPIDREKISSMLKAYAAYKEGVRLRCI